MLPLSVATGIDGAFLVVHPVKGLYMARLADMEIRNWIKSNERFEMRGDGDGLYLSYRDTYSIPLWRFRYRFAGKPRIVNIGSYRDTSLADARKVVKEYRARVFRLCLVSN